MERFAVRLVRPPGYRHSDALLEVAEAVEHGVRALGHDVVLRSEPTTDARRDIVVGWHLLDPDDASTTPDAVFYNLEQVSDDTRWLKPRHLDLLRRRRVWDYSALNIGKLAALGIDATHVPIGYAPGWTRIERMAEDIDVLFYGSMSQRRLDVIEAIESAGAVVEVSTGVYGAERDALIARSRIVLNMHYYDAQVFEIVRVSYLLANRRFVVSERGRDLALERPFEGGIAFGTYEELPALCHRYMHARAERRAIAERGFEVMRSMPMVESLRTALAAA
jgi:hypothetical protein